MIIAAGIKKLLDSNKYVYRVLEHKRATNLKVAASLLNIDPQQVLIVEVLADRNGELLVVYPVGRKINLDLCKQCLNRDLNILPSIEVNRIFNDCEAGSWPAIGRPYNIQIIIDQSIKKLTNVYFASGSHTSLIQMDVASYLQLNARAKVSGITTELVDAPATFIDGLVDNNDSLKSLIFPALPPVAMQILQLATQSGRPIKELVELVAQDAGIQQQIKFYMQLPFMQQQVGTAQHTFEHILGFDMVSHIAPGVAADAFAFWGHAFYAATIAERITKLVARDELNPAISYLAGLFHNFGLLLFSQLFVPEYNLLKKWLQQNPSVCISVLEKRLLGMGQAFNIARGGHAQLGEWLLRSWQLPESICVITKEHHSLTYKGEYADYVKIIQLTNHLLREEGIGDGVIGGIDKGLLDSLGLNAEQVYDSIKQIKAGVGAESLEQMARSLTSLE